MTFSKPLYARNVRKAPSGRLFAAIAVPGDWEEHIINLQRSLACAYADSVRWIPRESLHITIRFFGDVPEELAQRLISAWPSLSKELQDPLCIHPDWCGCFPQQGAERVLWAGAAVSRQGWSELLDLVDSHCALIGIPPSASKESIPHVTFGRIQPPRCLAGLRELLSTTLLDVLPFHVHEVHLMRSVLLPSGSAYSVCATLQLSS